MMSGPGQYENEDADPVFRIVASSWLTKIHAARSHKDEVFQKFANDCQSFYDGAKNWDQLMTGGATSQSGTRLPSPRFKVTINKTFEFVTLFGPALYFENPYRTARPRMPIVFPPEFFPDAGAYQAAMQQENQRVIADGVRGVLLEAVLNSTSNDFNLARQSRSAIDEALIKGRGCLWTGTHQSPGSDRISVRSMYDTVDNLFCDPDADTFDECNWIARRHVRAAWQVEREYKLRPGSLNGQFESHTQTAVVNSDPDGPNSRAQGKTNDLIVYYEVFSKMGIGGRLAGANRDHAPILEQFGDYCYCVVAEGVPFLLNLPPDVIHDEGFAADPRIVFGRTAWPIPSYAANSWPVSVLDFHPISKCSWPLAHLRAGMGELKALNWIWSFVMGKIRITSRDLLLLKKSLKEEQKDSVLNGVDLEMIEVEEGQTVEDICKFLQFPSINGDIWKVAELLSSMFDKRVGLNELMYGAGGATQIRSATEVQARSEAQNVRPADMARRVEEWQSAIAAKEALAARWLVRGADVAPILGQVGAQFWDTHVATTDPDLAAHQLEYRIESGSTQRPNRGTQIQQVTAAFTAISPILVANAQQTGDVAPLNNLLADYAKANDLDPGRYQVKAPPPLPAPATASPAPQGQPQPPA